MKKFNFRKLGILLAMMLVGGMVLVGPASAGWTYSPSGDYVAGAYGKYSSYPEGYLWEAKGTSYVGPVDIDLTVRILGTDATTIPRYTYSTVGTSLDSGLSAYYGTHDLTLPQYSPETENYALIGTSAITVYGHP